MGTEPPVPEEEAVGRRVFCGADRATVRYVGPVPPTEGLWFGVEWDDPDRGKHDGSHAGVRYFTCSPPRGGSFLRPLKVSFGLDYVSALDLVYSRTRLEVDHLFKDRPSLEPSLQTVKSVSLQGVPVNRAGPQGAVRTHTPNVQWLNLCRTLMTSWDEVASIAAQLEHLEELLLSYNTLHVTSDPWSLSGSFRNLRVLSLMGCELTWTQVMEVAPMWPQLEDLRLKENNITHIDRPDGLLQNLTTLSLSRNPLVQESLLNLSALPRLQQLSLNECGISHISFPDAAPGSQTDMFPELRELRVNNNNISEWGVVGELSKLRSLEKLCCRGNDLRSDDGKQLTANQMVIAQLGRLHTLNNSQISPEERRGAELDYIKLFGGAWLSAGGRSQSDDTFRRRHPRYLSLIHKHGAPDESDLRKPESFALKNQLLNVSFVFPDETQREQVHKKLPASMLVLKVKGLLQRLVKVPVTDLKLSYTTPKNPGTEYELDNDTKTLQFYSIEEGDQILVRWS